MWAKTTSHLREGWYYTARILKNECYVTDIGREDYYEECEEIAVAYILDNVI